MRLSSSIVVRRSVGDVFRFFREPANLARWDRSVARVVVTSEGVSGIGATFDTIGPAAPGREGLKTSYEVIRVEENRRADARVTHSNLFRSAVWQMEFAPLGESTRVTCTVDFALRLRYLPLAPILCFNRGAIDRDLAYLKTELEAEPA